MINSFKIAVIGAGGKMGMRVSNNLVKTQHTVWYAENSPAGQERVTAAGRTLTDSTSAVADADIVIFAVPDLALKAVTADLVPQMKPGAIALTLDPAAAYAGTENAELPSQASATLAKYQSFRRMASPP